MRKTKDGRKTMEYEIEKKKAPGRNEVEVLGRWRQKLESREEKLKYLQIGER